MKFICPNCKSVKNRQTKTSYFCLNCGLEYDKKSYKELRENTLSCEEASGIKEGLEEAFGDIPWDEVKKDLENIS